MESINPNETGVWKILLLVAFVLFAFFSAIMLAVKTMPRSDESSASGSPESRWKKWSQAMQGKNFIASAACFIGYILLLYCCGYAIAGLKENWFSNFGLLMAANVLVVCAILIRAFAKEHWLDTMRKSISNVFLLAGIGFLIWGGWVANLSEHNDVLAAARKKANDSARADSIAKANTRYAMMFTSVEETTVTKDGWTTIPFPASDSFDIKRNKLVGTVLMVNPGHPADTFRIGRDLPAPNFGRIGNRLFAKAESGTETIEVEFYRKEAVKKTDRLVDFLKKK